ncbi:BrnT family toxin [Halochromatium roseum]|uniref:BrnT family toxin n=1 Tax=Halochromatium roseum TaxID=391920 RepID=UPI0019130479|nr:BrnT family toxin [Halochromatium roseum]MBK5942149.1 hypothetical protein [Halochromatium roseum]
MNIVFDPAKDRRNLAKHRVSLALAGDLEWEFAQVREDLSATYDEQRWIGFAPIGHQIYCVVFTEDQDVYRIISLRIAENHEKRTYIDHL